MSFDVYFQGFHEGGVVDGGLAAMWRVIEPYITREGGETGFLVVEFGDGSADLYLGDDGMMANHVSGDDPWDLLVRGARDAGWVIMPVGVPTCLTRADQRAHLPEELADAAVVVTSGADLVRVIVAGEGA